MADDRSTRQAPSRLERWLLAALAAMVVAAGVLQIVSSRPASSHAELLEAARERYAVLWSEVDEVAVDAARTIGGMDLEAGAALAVFDRLALAVPGEDRAGWTLLLYGPLGQLHGWSGAGLVHRVEGEELPAAGRDHRLSLTAGTLLSVVPVEEHTGWRVVAGLSLSTQRLPFELPGRAGSTEIHWGLAPAGEPGLEGRAAVTLPATPTLLLDEAELAVAPEPGSDPPLWSRPLPWLGAWLLLAATAFRRRLGWTAVVLVGLALTVWARAASVGWGSIALLAAALLVAAVAAVRARDRERVAHPLAKGVLGVGLLCAFAWALQRPEPEDLARHFAGGGEVWVHRAILWLVALAVLAALARGRGEPAEAERQGRLWLGTALVAAAGCVIDWPVVAVLALLGGAAMLARGLARPIVVGRPLLLGGLVVLAALIAATADGIAYRAELRRQLAGPVLEALAPPTREETIARRGELERHFETLDLSDLSTGSLDELERDDLAFELWRRSPLARDRAVSAVSLRGFDGERLLFSFGVPVDSSGQPRVQSRERPFDRPVWDYALINESAFVRQAGEPWGEVEYWLLVRPGHRLAESELGDVSVDLLRGGPAGRGAVQELLRPALYAFYTDPQQVRISPWMEAPALPARVVEEGHGRMETPDGSSWVWVAGEAEGLRALFLPRLGPVRGFERVGLHALGSLWPLAAIAGFLFLLQLSRLDVRHRVRDVWRSYSRRLVLVFSLLVLLPAVVVDVLVLRILAERLKEEQLVEARSALSAAQRVLGEYAASQDPGLGLDTLFDDDLMAWLAQVLGHDVNLYWLGTSRVSASSRQELFAAGLLPQRIPGEIYSDIRLRGHRLASRLHSVDGIEYAELWAPLALPGEDPQSADYFLSIPLMAQAEAVASEIEGLRHTVVLATVLLVLLLVALGARLAASFTTPLEELVAGTQRIAAGAERLGLEPKELELATLVEAIDRMAERVADGRRKLLLEKEVVERMVDNITAAVVSIDADHRVLMQNEVARKLLGTETGESLEEALARDDRLGQVLEGLHDSQERGGPQAVTLPSAEEGEPRQWSLVWVPIPGAGEPKALVVIEDVTEVVRGQRLQAWAEMARMIAHEIKNPLTPIRLSAEHLRELRDRDPRDFDRVFDQCIANILEHVDELRTISTEFSTYSRIPRIEPTRGNLTAEVRELVSGYQLAHPAGVEVRFAGDEEVELSFDSRLLLRALRNLIENALRAVGDAGRVEVIVEGCADKVVIDVRDDGPGVSADELGRIFEPYFSTHDTGTGLGLPIARRIVEQHGGEMTARNLASGGLAVRVELPRAAAEGDEAVR